MRCFYMVYYFRTLFFYFVFFLTFQLGAVFVLFFSVSFPWVKLMKLCGFWIVPRPVCRAERLSCSLYASTLLFSISFPRYNVRFSRLGLASGLHSSGLHISFYHFFWSVWSGGRVESFLFSFFYKDSTSALKLLQLPLCFFFVSSVAISPFFAVIGRFFEWQCWCPLVLHSPPTSCLFVLWNQCWKKSCVGPSCSSHWYKLVAHDVSSSGCYGNIIYIHIVFEDEDPRLF